MWTNRQLYRMAFIAGLGYYAKTIREAIRITRLPCLDPVARAFWYKRAKDLAKECRKICQDAGGLRAFRNSK